jgi:hypothetical protein
MPYKAELDRHRALVADATARVEKQVKLIAKLRSIGSDPQFSEVLLRNYTATQATRELDLEAYEVASRLLHSPT